MSDKMKRWQKNAKDTYKDLKDIDPDKATKQQFILYAACIALQGHEDYQGEVTHSTPETDAQGENEGAVGVLLDYMADELADSERYIKLWQQTGNADFKGVANDELRHFQILAKYARTVEPNIDLNPYMVRHNALLARLV